MFESLRTRSFASRNPREGRRPRSRQIGVETLEQRWVPAAFTTPSEFGTGEWAIWDTNSQMKVLTGDFNGDGKTDVMKFDVPSSGTAQGGLWVGLSDGAGHFNTSRWATWDMSTDTKVLAGDFNGDGKTDVMKFDVPSSGTAQGGLWVGISNGAGTFNTSRWATWDMNRDVKVLAGDFNGDGKTDVMKFDVPSSGSSANGLWVGISNGAGSFNTSRWATWITNTQMKVLAGDFNGDGKTDVMKFDVPSSGTARGGLWVGLSDGAGNFNTSQWATWDTNTDIKVLAGDFNGDGKTDVMKFDVPSSGSSANGLWVGISNGAGSFNTSRWATWITNRDIKVLAGDFNGDGKTDVMKFDVPSSGTARGGLWVGLSDGAGNFNTSQWATWDTNTQMVVLAGNFNGDRLTDVMKFDVPSVGTSSLGLWVGISAPPPPALSSLPGASVTVYLDFNGYYEKDWWGVGQGDGYQPVFDMDGDPNTFSATEEQRIRDIWALVADDYSIFNVNVTTVNPGDFSNGKAIRLAVKYASDGGVSHLDGFTNSASNSGFASGSSAEEAAVCISHEAGHLFGLQHQQTSGTADKRPIMFGTVGNGRSIWWQGTDTNGNFQDDIAVISRAANGFGLRADDFGNSISTAKVLAQSGNRFSQAGIIGTTSDADFFRFTTSGGTCSISVPVGAFAADLDARLELYNSAGVLIASAAPSTSLGASITLSLASGTYYVAVKSQGNYGDVGQYTLNGTVPQSFALTGATLSPTASGGSQAVRATTGEVSPVLFPVGQGSVPSVREGGDRVRKVVDALLASESPAVGAASGPAVNPKSESPTVPAAIAHPHEVLDLVLASFDPLDGLR